MLQDIGISAFRGANAADGVLGWFLEVAKAGKIPGSFLLVESLDRLSRQEPRKSLRIFLDIIDAGINIVTLMDNHVYNAEKIDRPDGVMELFGSIMIMARANEESNTKRDRVANAWDNKRRNAATKPLTSICPGWLNTSKDKKVLLSFLNGWRLFVQFLRILLLA
jgi:DNA invertase Pin-like site-specific DNA recombinase